MTGSEPVAGCNDPVAVFLFNRPAHVRAVLDAVRLARPSTVFVVADGPRDQADERDCHEAREVVLRTIDWPCRLVTNFRTENLGTARSVSSGLDWVFEQTDRAIILEDDC